MAQHRFPPKSLRFWHYQSIKRSAFGITCVFPKTAYCTSKLSEIPKIPIQVTPRRGTLDSHSVIIIIIQGGHDEVLCVMPKWTNSNAEILRAQGKTRRHEHDSFCELEKQISIWVRLGCDFECQFKVSFNQKNLKRTLIRKMLTLSSTMLYWIQRELHVNLPRREILTKFRLEKWTDSISSAIFTFRNWFSCLRVLKSCACLNRSVI